MPFSLITVDFWNTLVDNAGHESRGSKRIKLLIDEGAQQGLDLSKQQARQALDDGWTFFREIWLDHHRTPPPHEMVVHILGRLGIDGSNGVLDKLSYYFQMGVATDPPRLLPGVASALKAMAEKSPLAIVSDTALSGGVELRKVLEDQGVLQYFSAFSFSDETGVAKPHPKAFTTVLDAMKAAPSQSIHIGDIERTDVVGARNLGMEAVLFTGDHKNSVVKSDVATTVATHVAHDWEEVASHIGERT